MHITASEEQQEMAAELELMVREQALYLENIEPLAARLGLTPAGTILTLRECQRRLRVLVKLQWTFERILNGDFVVVPCSKVRPPWWHRLLRSVGWSA